jgi:large subunit ribosomal protein L6
MSRVGKKPILIPESIEVKVEGQKIVVKGPKGETSRQIGPEIKIEIKDGKIFVLPQLSATSVLKTGGGKKTKAMWGLTRVLISNMIKGVSEGFQKQLELEGLGFRVQLSGEVLSLHVGFSHPVKIEAPPGIKFSTEKNIITVSGIDKELVGQTAAIIRKVKLPEPYKGKGIKYLGEQIRKKVGKKAVATAGAK